MDSDGLPIVGPNVDYTKVRSCVKIISSCIHLKSITVLFRVVHRIFGSWKKKKSIKKML